jgi:hypothetical protein
MRCECPLRGHIRPFDRGAVAKGRYPQALQHLLLLEQVSCRQDLTPFDLCRRTAREDCLITSREKLPFSK